MKAALKRHIVAIIFGIVGLASFCAAVYVGHEQYQLGKVGITATGQVTKINEFVDDDNNLMYRPQVTFVTQWGRVEFEGKMATNYKVYQVGDDVPVIYPPDNPKDAQIDTFMQRFFLVSMFSLFALVFLTIAFGKELLSIRRQRMLKRLKSKGIRIKAEITEISPYQRNSNEYSQAYVIRCKGHHSGTGEVEEFVSPVLKSMPTTVQVGDTIDVYSELKDAKKYVVDCESLMA